MEAQLWFDRFAWLVFLMPFLGLAVAGLSRRTDPIIKGKVVLRHDGPRGSRIGRMPSASCSC